MLPLYTLLFLAQTALFDGKSLDGWMWSHDPNPPQPSWAARDGMLIATPGIGAGNSKGHGGWFYDWVIFPLFTRKAYADKDAQEDLIRRSNLAWTIVRPASFTNGPRRGKLRSADDLEGITISSISRADTAAFVLDQLNTNEWLNRSPLIGY